MSFELSGVKYKKSSFNVSDVDVWVSDKDNAPSLSWIENFISEWKESHEEILIRIDIWVRDGREPRVDYKIAPPPGITLYESRSSTGEVLWRLRTCDYPVVRPSEDKAKLFDDLFGEPAIVFEQRTNAKISQD